MNDDHMQIGDTGLVALENGWFLHTISGMKIGPDGSIVDENGKVVGQIEIDDD